MRIKEVVEALNQNLSPEALTQKHCWVLYELCNQLIGCLYKVGLDDEGQTHFYIDPERCKEYKVDVDDEPVNWGHLHCFDVIPKNDYFEVWVEEASPDCCKTLCEYLEEYLEKSGYNVKVRTEW